jgi:hypothetical protein
MCCFLTALVFFGPRLAVLILWLIPWGRLKMAAAFDGWIVQLLGFIFLPWTLLMYVLVFPVVGVFDWILVGLGLFADIMGYVGGYRNRRQVPGYR